MAMPKKGESLMIKHGKRHTICYYKGGRVLSNIQNDLSVTNLQGKRIDQPLLTLERTWVYLHSAPILNFFMISSTFTNRNKITALLKYLNSLVKMSTLNSANFTNSEHYIKTNHKTYWVIIQTGFVDNGLWLENFMDFGKVEEVM